MNVETANRLAMLRKKMGYSQEQLAEKMGIYRQAISKWERAEASPDTDNLIALARIYEVSLDELLGYKEQEVREENKGEEDNKKRDYVHIGWDGIHVEDGKESVHIGWKEGIHVNSADNSSVHIDSQDASVYVNGEQKYKRTKADRIIMAVFSIAVTVFFIVIGAIEGYWHPTWLLFLLIPILDSLLIAVRNKNPHEFAYPVVAALAFLIMGFYLGLWHPAWVVFLTVPVYYMIFPKGKKNKEEQ